LEEVKYVLSILEAVEFKWTVSEVLEQDETWTKDILEMKSIGAIIRENSRKKAMKDG